MWKKGNEVDISKKIKNKNFAIAVFQIYFVSNWVELLFLLSKFRVVNCTLMFFNLLVQHELVKLVA